MQLQIPRPRLAACCKRPSCSERHIDSTAQRLEGKKSKTLTFFLEIDYRRVGMGFNRFTSLVYAALALTALVFYTLMLGLHSHNNETHTQMTAFFSHDTFNEKPINQVSIKSHHNYPYGTLFTMKATDHYYFIPKKTFECSQKQISILSLVLDSSSWGIDRTLKDHFKLLSTFSYPQECMSLAFLITSDDERAQVLNYIATHPQPFKSIFIMDEPLLKTNGGVSSREDRHDDSVQFRRRRHMAVLRNTLLNSVLAHDMHVASTAFVWLDADVKYVPVNTLLRMVYSEKDIVVARCDGAGGGEYDLNTWAGKRKVPSDQEWERVKNGERDAFVPGPDEQSLVYLSELESLDSEYVPDLLQVDSVVSDLILINCLLLVNAIYIYRVPRSYMSRPKFTSRVYSFRHTM
jgi:hypothetical protein